jgi:ABC-type lipoprotein release transport system permease subunit
MLEDMLKNLGKGTINVYHKKYKESPSIRNTLIFTGETAEKLRNMEYINEFFQKVETAGLLSKGENTVGVAIEGVNLEKSLKVGRIKIIKGYLPKSTSLSVLMGEKLAKAMDINVGDTVLIITQDYYGSISVDFFMVAALFKSSNPELEKFTIMMNISTLQNFLSIPDRVTEIAILTKKLRIGGEIRKKIQKLFENAMVLTWKEDLPEMKQLLELDSGGAWIAIYVLVFLVILIIFTTIFMNTMERTREFGVMMAVGTKTSYIRLTVILEGVIIGAIGATIGIVLGFLLSFTLSVKPFYFRSEFYGELIGFSEFKIMTRILFSHFVYTFFLTLIFSLFASLFPARKVSKLKPSEALRYV